MWYFHVSWSGCDEHCRGVEETRKTKDIGGTT